MKKIVVLVLLVAATALGFHLTQRAPHAPITPASDTDGQWRDAAGDPQGRRYSALTQINRDTVDRLKVAWTYHAGLPSKESGWRVYNLQTTPILVEGNLVGCNYRKDVFALDPTTGLERWRFTSGEGANASNGSHDRCRGVVAWTDPGTRTDDPCHTRILHAAGTTVYALDVKTGKTCEGFGKEGAASFAIPGIEGPDEVDLRTPGNVVNDVVIFGSAIRDAYRKDSPRGTVRAFDVRTGAIRWEYDPIPTDAADPAYATWENDSAKDFGAANVWSRVAVDAVNNLVFLPTTSPSNDYDGIGRPGDNRWSNSVIALDATTGKHVWAFQVTHHDVWDRDLPTQPILVDIDKDGAKVPALVQLTKHSFVFVLNRLTGEPIHPVEERAVATDTDVPGEKLSPTQPFPVKTPPLSPTSLTVDEAWGFTPLDRAACRKQIAQFRSEGAYTPLSQRGTVVVPGLSGGSNWGGGAVDVANNLLIVPTQALPGFIKLVPRDYSGTDYLPKGDFLMRGSPYIARANFILSPLGAPCSAPPWAKLVAVDLVSGGIKWEVPLGSIERQAWYAPPLMLGTPISGGAMVTAGGIAFVGATTDRKFRAFDLNTGEILWTAKLPAPGMATPMTYAVNGRQYVVIAAGGNQIFHPDIGDSIIAYALED